MIEGPYFRALERSECHLGSSSWITSTRSYSTMPHDPPFDHNLQAPVPSRLPKKDRFSEQSTSKNPEKLAFMDGH